MNHDCTDVESRDVNNFTTKYKFPGTWLEVDLEGSQTMFVASLSLPAFTFVIIPVAKRNVVMNINCRLFPYVPFLERTVSP